MNPGRLVWVGLGLIFVGFVVVAVGALGFGGPASTGGFILIGPIPIVFGSGQNSGLLASVAIVIFVVMVLAYLASFLLWRSARRQEVETEPESE